MVAIRFEVFGDQIVEREILRVGERADDFRPVFATLHRSFLGIERTQFSSEGRNSGGWRPLAPSTVAAKARQQLDPRILHATLDLRNSLTRPTDANHVYRATADEMFVGSRVSYGVFHQHGTKKMPRRPPVALTEAHKRRWVKELQGWLVHGGAFA